MARLSAAILVLCWPAAALGDGVGFCPGDAPQHTGYLAASPDAEYFYYLATSRSATPRADPLVLWLTGGPGCSSVLALLFENGPCRVEGRTPEGEWLMGRNHWSWTEVANVLYVDQPVGVGYSNPGNDLIGTELQVGERMFTFLQNFYAKFPHFLEVPLFVTGESYGGHYVPVVAAHVLRGQGQGVGVIAGIGVGNGLVDSTIQFASKPIMAYTGGGGSLQQGVIDLETYLAMERDLPACEAEIRMCQEAPNPQQCVTSMMTCMLSEVVPVVSTGVNPYDLRKKCATTRKPSDPASSLCYDTEKEMAFLNDPDIKQKIGVPQWRQWEPCNMTPTIPFILSGDELFDFREAVIELLRGDVHVVIYAGDCDFMVDWIGSRAWVQQLSWPHREAWAQAPQDTVVIENRTAALRQSAHGLTFVQVRDAGHLVPRDQPQLALALIRGMIDATKETVSSKMRAAAASRLTASRDSGAALTLVIAATLVALASVCAALGGARAQQVARVKPGYYLMA